MACSEEGPNRAVVFAEVARTASSVHAHRFARPTRRAGGAEPPSLPSYASTWRESSMKGGSKPSNAACGSGRTGARVGAVDRRGRAPFMIVIASCPCEFGLSPIFETSRARSRLCATRTGEPVFITNDGREDLVVMSVAAWERQRARLDLYTKLGEAEADVQRGDRGVAVATLRRRLLGRVR
jgi:prevent-host-death family protein